MPSPLVLVERCEVGPRTLATRGDTRQSTCRRGRLIPESARPSPSNPDDHLQGRNFPSNVHRSNFNRWTVRDTPPKFFARGSDCRTMSKNVLQN
ncbi:unnamed protein product [Lasius platythorax]|uniref:Uncharacterized protein n=1 Tax=Lasius platythorax TaxID=488582 RepID=A0AAV2NTD3_9HYME